MSRLKSAASGFLAIVSMMMICGCSSSTFLRTSSAVVTAPARMIESAIPAKPVGKILCLWEPAEGQGVDELPARGFAGQILFFAHGSPSPMKVKGEVAIYEYVDYDENDDAPTPIHVFRFDSGAWNAHRSEGTLGHSYNVFLPYVLKDRQHSVCALRVEITTEDGRKVSSPYTSVTLAAKTSHRAASGIQREVVTRSTTPVGTTSQQVSAAAASAPEKSTLDTVTIPLPSRR
ncbi:MAG: hypothetical protein R3C49_13015 [Planctomycetaceae bacterium]